MATARSDRPTRQAKKLEKRAAIHDAALACFTSQGFAETTVAEIAAQAGVAKGTVFLYADDKDDLLCLVVHGRLAAAAEAALATRPTRGPLRAELLHVFGVLLRTHAEFPGLARDFLRVSTSARGRNAERLAGLTRQFVVDLAGLVAAAKARGELAADVSEAVLASAAFTLYFGALTAFVHGYVPTIDAAIDPGLRDGLELLLRGLDRPAR